MKTTLLVYLFLLLCTFSLQAQNDNQLPIMTEEVYYKLADYDFTINELGNSDSLVGKSAPNFKFRTLKGDSIELAELKGKAVVITFFYCLCAPCSKEIPTINKLVKNYTQKDVVFIAISTKDTPEDIKARKSFLSRKKIDSNYNEEVIIVPASYFGNRGDGYRNQSMTKTEGDGNEYNNQVREILQEQYLIKSVPANFFIDKEGIIRFISRGHNSKYDYYSFYSDKIEELLKE